jgi:hypothetical protein
MLFECARCDYVAKNKCDLYKHYFRKNQCQPVKSDTSCEELAKALYAKDNKYECEYCKQKYKTAQSKYWHKKSCKFVEQKTNVTKSKHIEQILKYNIEDVNLASLKNNITIMRTMLENFHVE